MKKLFKSFLITIAFIIVIFIIIGLVGLLIQAVPNAASWLFGIFCFAYFWWLIYQFTR